MQRVLGLCHSSHPRLSSASSVKSLHWQLQDQKCFVLGQGLNHKRECLMCKFYSCLCERVKNVSDEACETSFLKKFINNSCVAASSQHARLIPMYFNYCMQVINLNSANPSCCAVWLELAKMFLLEDNAKPWSA